MSVKKKWLNKEKKCQKIKKLHFIDQCIILEISSE